MPSGTLGIYGVPKNRMQVELKKGAPTSYCERHSYA